MEEAELKHRYEAFTANAATYGAVPYLVLDGAWQDRLISVVRQDEKGWEPLVGLPTEDKAASLRKSPLVVDLTTRPEILVQWLAGGFREKLGIIVFSDLPIQGIRSSLKRFLTVLLPTSSSPSYFRFWDARILNCFLRTGFHEQWEDFFRDIMEIAAPTDLSEGWCRYKLVAGALNVSLDTACQLGSDWTPIPTTSHGVDAYSANYPYRRIDQAQYEAIMRCSRTGLHHEILEFLEKAFPEKVAKTGRFQTLKIIDRCHALAEAEGYRGRTCAFYWSVLGFMRAPDFHLNGDVKEFLEIEYLSPRQKLEQILLIVNLALKNEHVEQLLDVWDCRPLSEEEIE